MQQSVALLAPSCCLELFWFVPIPVVIEQRRLPHPCRIVSIPCGRCPLRRGVNMGDYSKDAMPPREAKPAHVFMSNILRMRKEHEENLAVVEDL